MPTDMMFYCYPDEENSLCRVTNSVARTIRIAREMGYSWDPKKKRKAQVREKNQEIIQYLERPKRKHLVKDYDEKDVVAAKQAWQHHQEMSDNCYILAQNLGKKLSPGKDSTRTIMLVNCQFVDVDSMKKPINVVLPIDLTTNPFRLFIDKNGYGTIDEKITTEETRNFLSTNGRSLWEKGYKHYIINASKFFLLPEKLISQKYPNRLIRNNSMDLETLTEITTRLTEFPTNEEQGERYVLDKNIEVPNLIGYVEKAMPFVSYRFKRSLLEKSLELWATKESKDMMIGDVVGFRLTVESEKKVQEMKEYLLSNPTMGNWNIKVFENPPEMLLLGNSKLCIDDYYEKPKDNGYRSVHIICRVESGNDCYVASFHITDWLQYFENEINPFSAANHNKYKITNQKRIIEALRNDYLYGRQYQELQSIFGDRVQLHQVVLK